MARKGKIATAGAAAVALSVAFIGGWEGLRTTAYQDLVNKWTVCYGETRGVKPGDSYTKVECDSMLAARIDEFDRGLDRCLAADLPVETRIAVVSWTYNMGLGAACRSTLVRKANAGDLIGACNELPRWNWAGGRVIQGLTNRRVSERALCLRGLE